MEVGILDVSENTVLSLDLMLAVNRSAVEILNRHSALKVSPSDLQHERYDFVVNRGRIYVFASNQSA